MFVLAWTVFVNAWDVFIYAWNVFVLAWKVFVFAWNVFVFGWNVFVLAWNVFVLARTWFYLRGMYLYMYATHIDICSSSSECRVTDLAFEYTGTLSHTHSGLTCQRWDVDSPHSYGLTGPETFPGGVISDSQVGGFSHETRAIF